MSGNGKNFNSKFYCKKHDLLYMEHLHRCPICLGEKMKPATIHPNDIPYNRKKAVPKRVVPRAVPGQVPKRVVIPKRVVRRI